MLCHYFVRYFWLGERSKSDTIQILCLLTLCNDCEGCDGLWTTINSLMSPISVVFSFCWFIGVHIQFIICKESNHRYKPLSTDSSVENKPSETANLTGGQSLKRPPSTLRYTDFEGTQRKTNRIINFLRLFIRFLPFIQVPTMKILCIKL